MWKLVTLTTAVTGQFNIFQWKICAISAIYLIILIHAIGITKYHLSQVEGARVFAQNWQSFVRVCK